MLLPERVFAQPRPEADICLVKFAERKNWNSGGGSIQLETRALHHFGPFFGFAVLGFVEVKFPNSGGVIDNFASHLRTENMPQLNQSQEMAARPDMRGSILFRK